MKNDWKVIDAEREREAEAARGAREDVNSDLGKVFHYEKECALLDEYHDHYVKTGVVVVYDMAQMMQRTKVDGMVWALWLEEVAERQESFQQLVEITPQVA